MARAASLYPPSPRDVPADLTTPTGDYKSRVVLVLFSLLLFFCLYLGLIVGSAVMIVLSYFMLPLIFELPVIAFFLFLFLFLVKGLFRGRGKKEKSLQVEVTEDEHPRLYDFIDKLCAEVNTPFPNRIFLCPDVNAAVFYDKSPLSLFLPTPKNLLIGLGLVNVLNLSEFKGVLAHEFGHFSQNSMKLGRYVYVANNIIANIVDGRDWMDEMIRHMKNQRSAIFLLGWAMHGITEAFRLSLIGCYNIINFLDFSLSRQMEYNADLYSVMTVGSDAATQPLFRLEFANDAFMQAWADLKIAAEHNLYTSDLFYHQNHAATYLRRVRKDPHLGEPPPVPDDPNVMVELFEPEEDSKAHIWTTHPSKYDREQNIKRHYIRCEIDDRSPWLLFDDLPAVRELVTWRFYRVAGGVKRDVVLADPEGVQAFIDNEHAETTYDPRYHGMYDRGRTILPGDLREHVRTVKEKPWKPEKLVQVYQSLYGADLKTKMEDNNRSWEDKNMLMGLKYGYLEAKDGRFKFRGRYHGMGAIKRLLKQVEREIEDDWEWMSDLDRKVFLVHFQMALELGAKFFKELMGRYEFHLAIQQITFNVLHQTRELQQAVAFINSGQSMSNRDKDKIWHTFQSAYKVLKKSIKDADNLMLPELKNLTAGEPLGYFLLDRELLQDLPARSGFMSLKWMNKLLRQLNQVDAKSKRVFSKSWGGILLLQETIAKKWMDELASLPEVNAADTENSERTKPATPAKKFAAVNPPTDSRVKSKVRHQTFNE